MDELNNSGGTLVESLQACFLLRSLPKEYDPIKAVILSSNAEICTINYAKSHLMNFEAQLILKPVELVNNKREAKVLEANRQDQQNNFFKKGQNNNFKKNNNRRFSQNKKNNNFKNHQGKENGFLKKYIYCKFCKKSNHTTEKCRLIKRFNNFQKFHGESETQTRTMPYSNMSADNVAPSSLSKKITSLAFMAGNASRNYVGDVSFIIDSGATDHTINNEELFESFIELNPPIKIATAKNSEFILATKMGLVKMHTEYGHHRTLEDVLYCREAAHNLLSVEKMRKADMEIIFNKQGVTIKKLRMTIMTAKPINNSNIINFKVDNSKSAYNVTEIKNNYMIWHQRLGHIGNQCK